MSATRGFWKEPVMSTMVRKSQPKKVLAATAAGIAVLGLALSGCGESRWQIDEAARQAAEEGASLGGAPNADLRMERMFNQ